MPRLLLACCLIALAAAPAPQRPATAAPVTHHFGRVRQGETVTHEFTLRNPSASGPVRVLRVELNGPGMTARFKPETPAGQPVSIRVAWNTSKIEGEVEAQGVVRWADPKLPVTAFTIAGHVVPPIELRPMGVAFFSVFTDERAEQVIQLLNHEPRPLIVQKIAPAGSHFTAALRELERGRRYEVRVSVPAGLAPGRFMERLAVHTDSPARPVLQIPVNVLVKADLYANPEVVEFGNVPGAAVRRNPALGKLLTQTFLVKHRQRPFEIRRVTTDVPGLTIRVSPGGSQPTHQIDVSLADDQLIPRSLNGSIRLLTSDPGVPRILIPVRGQIQ
jgi:hypothetical protein